MRPRFLAFLTFLSAAGLLARAPPAAADAAEEKRLSDELFYEGTALMANGGGAEACKKLEQSLVLLRRGGTLLNLALCREGLGESAAAVALFDEALAMAERDGRADRRDVARQHLDALRAKLPATAPATATANTPAATSPAISAPAATSPAASQSASPTASPTDNVAPALAATAPARQPSLSPDRAPARAPEPDRDPPDPAARGLGHARQLGAQARVDIDPLHPGARVATGLTYGLDDAAELGLSALLGRDLGVEPQLALFLLRRSAWKPLVHLAVPIFFDGAARVGIRAAAGVQWDPLRHLGLFATVGGAYFPDVAPGYAHTLFLPSIGVQGRL